MDIYICYHYTQGLHNDALILKESLSEYKVHLESYNEINIYQDKPNSLVENHIVIFLEHINKNYINCKRILFFPNYEHLSKSDVQYMNSNIDLVCCKTLCTKKYIINILKIDERKVIYTGFSSKNKHIPTEVKKKAFLHVKGVSNKKNTEILLNTWLKHPEWPILHIVQQYDYSIYSDIIMDNVIITQRRLDEGELTELMNNYTYHICPSVCEGFGHYISEGLSCAAVVITNNSEPMNEIVNHDNGILIDNCNIYETKMKIIECKVTDKMLEEVVQQAISLDKDHINSLAENAQRSFHNNLKNFNCKINIIVSFIYNDVI